MVLSLVDKASCVAAGSGFVAFVLYHRILKNADGSPMRARPNGRCKTWKTRPDEFRLPVNHGLHDYGYVTHDNCDDWTWDEHTAIEGWNDD